MAFNTEFSETRAAGFTYCSMMPGSGFLGRERSRVPRGVIGRERLDKLLHDAGVGLLRQGEVKGAQRCDWEGEVGQVAHLEVHVVPVLILELLCGEVGPLEVRYGPPVYMVARDDMVGSVDVDDLMRCWVQL